MNRKMRESGANRNLEYKLATGIKKTQEFQESGNDEERDRWFESCRDDGAQQGNPISGFGGSENIK